VCSVVLPWRTFYCRYMFKINGLNWQLDPDTYYSIKGVYGFSRILIKERRWLKILFEKELLLCSFGNFYIIGYRLKTTYCIVNIASFGLIIVC
jgi:hypothetical protein